MKKMLINATQPEEVRVAIVDGQKLYDLDIEATNRQQKKSNIYKGRVMRVENSLEAVFVDYGCARNGFLPFKEISFSLFDNQTKTKQRPNIHELIKEGQELIVQVEKEERGNKGAALTTFVSLAGRYLVLLPNNPESAGISRQIAGSDREEAKTTMSQLDIHEDSGLIIRTAGLGKSKEELQWDYDYLINLWRSISKATKERAAPCLIYQESEIIIRAIRDYLRNDISEILIDNKKVYERSHVFMLQVMPHNLHKLKFYEGNDPLFSRFQIEHQIEAAFERTCRLPSGGSLVIDHTEALISIDINSGRSTKGSDIEATALDTNIEAVDEIARQLRLRDLGGLIVIDFIDMADGHNQRLVENRFWKSLSIDRARVQSSRISRFGLMEMSRQRLKPSLVEANLTCPRCQGEGTIRDTESIALSILRIIEEDAMKDSTAQVIANLPVDVATFLLNEKRQPIADLEYRLDLQIIIVPTPSVESPSYTVRRVRLPEKNNEESQKSSYQQIPKPENDSANFLLRKSTPPQEKAVVEQITPARPLPNKSNNSQTKSPSILQALTKLITPLLQIFKPAKKSEKNIKPRRNRNRNRSRSRSENKQKHGQGGKSNINNVENIDKQARPSPTKSRQRRNRRQQQTKEQGSSHQNANRKSQTTKANDNIS